jgi:hypothetical protein
MSLPLKAVDRLFERLGVTYGADWDRSLGSAPIADVKGVWAHELAGFADKLPLLAWALENLPERPPNVIQFRNLCRLAPAPSAPRLPEPKADPARVAAELAKLRPAISAAQEKAAAFDHTGWAKRILARHDGGERLSPTTVLFARQALGKA